MISTQFIHSTVPVFLPCDRWGFVVTPEKSPHLGNSCSCTESIDVFSQFGDLVLIDVQRGMRTDKQTGRQDQRWRDRVLRIRTGTSNCYKDHSKDC